MVVAFLFSELTSLCPILSWRFCVLSSLIPLAILSFDGRFWPLPPVLVETPLSLAHDTSISWSCRCFPCGSSCSVPVTTHWSPSTSPLLTPSSLPWQTPLCPGLPLGLPFGLLDSQMYISGLDLLSRSYTHRHCSLLRWKVSLILVISKTPWLNTSLFKLMTFAPVSGPLPWTFEAASYLVHPHPLLSHPVHSPRCGQCDLFKGRSDLTSFYLKLFINLGIRIVE